MRLETPVFVLHSSGRLAALVEVQSQALTTSEEGAVDEVSANTAQPLVNTAWTREDFAIPLSLTWERQWGP